MADQSYPLYILELSAEDGGGYMAYVPDLIGCMADGESIAEAVEEARSAIGEWIDEARRLGRAVPEPGDAGRRQYEQREALWKLIDKQEAILKEKDDLILEKESALQLKESVLKALRAEVDELKQRDAEVDSVFSACTRAFGHKIGRSYVVLSPELPEDKCAVLSGPVHAH